MQWTDGMRRWQVVLGSDKGRIIGCCEQGRGGYVKRGDVCGHVSEC